MPPVARENRPRFTSSRKCLTANLLLALISAVSAKTGNSAIAEILHRPIRGLSYPEDSTMGLFLALAVPLEDPYNSVSMSYFFEAAYQLPPNSTDFLSRSAAPAPAPETSPETNPERIKRSIDRATIYRALRNKFRSSGYPGEACLLRAICEASEYPLNHNGLIGDILHVLFTPSSSRDEEELPRDVAEAETLGRNASCELYRLPCPLGLFELIGTLA